MRKMSHIQATEDTLQHHHIPKERMTIKGAPFAWRVGEIVPSL